MRYRKISNLNSHIVYLCLTVHVNLTVSVLKWLSVGRHSEFFLSHPGECFLLCRNPWSRERRTWQENQTSSTACIWIRKQFITCNHTMSCQSFLYDFIWWGAQYLFQKPIQRISHILMFSSLYSKEIIKTSISLFQNIKWQTRIISMVHVRVISFHLSSYHLKKKYSHSYTISLKN